MMKITRTKTRIKANIKFTKSRVFYKRDLNLQNIQANFNLRYRGTMPVIHTWVIGKAGIHLWIVAEET